ncbi:TPA: DUF4427 domain-containing protein [Photobacterium damselae]
MAINSIRFDLSDRLIHFFRDIDFDGPNAIPFVEHMGWENVTEDANYSALFMLRCAIRSGRLWATWSYRNGVRTIYGPDPAVCFTEMPIAAFMESSESRHQRGEAMSPFALIFPKRDMFQAGSNPVIYGLDKRDYSLPLNKDGEERIIDPKILAIREQYRYVTYNPMAKTPIDWSHEREWRWPYRGSYVQVEKELEKFGLIEDFKTIPGFNFYQEDVYGIGVVVRTQVQGQRVVYDILSLIDRGDIDRYTFSFILVTDELPSIRDLIHPQDMQTAISSSLIDLSPFFSYEKNELAKLANEFSSIVKKLEDDSLPPEAGTPGGCWLWILDNMSILTRALLEDERITITESGRYLVELYEFNDSRGLEQRERMTTKLAKLIRKTYGIECGFFSVLNSDNPNEVPFYNGDHLDNNFYYNKSYEY